MEVTPWVTLYDCRAGLAPPQVLPLPFIRPWPFSHWSVVAYLLSPPPPHLDAGPGGDGGHGGLCWPLPAAQHRAQHGVHTQCGSTK